jgi:hypothetical protein
LSGGAAQRAAHDPFELVSAGCADVHAIAAHTATQVDRGIAGPCPDRLPTR